MLHSTCGREVQTAEVATHPGRDSATGAPAGFPDGLLARGATGAHPIALPCRGERFGNCPCGTHDAKERRQVDQQGLGSGRQCSTEGRYHRPKDPRITEDAKAWVVHVACSKPKELGYAAEVWSRSALARHVREHAVQAGYPSLNRAAKATVQRILASQPLHPEKVKYYLERRDPDFEAKMREVLLVYQEVALQNQNGGLTPLVITVSVDEMKSRGC